MARRTSSLGASRCFLQKGTSSGRFSAAAHTFSVSFRSARLRNVLSAISYSGWSPYPSAVTSASRWRGWFRTSGEDSNAMTLSGPSSGSDEGTPHRRSALPSASDGRGASHSLQSPGTCSGGGGRRFSSRLRRSENVEYGCSVSVCLQSADRTGSDATRQNSAAWDRTMKSGWDRSSATQGASSGPHSPSLPSRARTRCRNGGSAGTNPFLRTASRSNS